MELTQDRMTGGHSLLCRTLSCARYDICRLPQYFAAVPNDFSMLKAATSRQLPQLLFRTIFFGREQKRLRKTGKELLKYRQKAAG